MFINLTMLNAWTKKIYWQDGMGPRTALSGCPGPSYRLVCQTSEGVNTVWDLSNGKYLVLWKKTSEGWKMFRDSFSGDSPSGTPAWKIISIERAAAGDPLIPAIMQKGCPCFRDSLWRS
jgi:hypothetical protein